MRRRQYISAGITALLALVTVCALMVMHLAVTEADREWPPRREGSIAMADDNFFDVEDDIPVPAPAREKAAPTQTPEPAVNHSEPAPQTGHDVADRGPNGEAPTTVTSRRPSEVKAQTPREKPKPQGPSKEELEEKKRQEEARRRANSATSNAFNRANGNNNTANRGPRDGNSGRPDGTSASVNGTGTGSVGGGWIIPAYARVPSTVTGSIKMQVKIDRTGRVTSVAFTGGNPPAATDARLRAAVEAEVRGRRFTRANPDDAPASATAYITYTFR